MPFTTSHPAAVVPLKIWRARSFAGTALVVGSMAPDFEFFLKGRTGWGIGHTLAGQFVFCLPLTLVLTWLFRSIVARPLFTTLPDAGEFHLRDYALLNGIPAGYWRRIIPSALVGSFSHIIWDSFTHQAGVSARALGYSDTVVAVGGGHTLLLCKLLQGGSTLGGALVVLACMRYIGRNRLIRRWSEASVRIDLQETVPHRAWLPAFTLLGAIAGFGVAWMTGGAHALHHVQRFGFAAILFGSLGLAAGCALHRLAEAAAASTAHRTA